MICPIGHGIKDGKFCDVCGEKLVKEPKTSSKSPYEVMGENKCPGCGYELKHGHQHYCPGCGHEIKWLCR